MRTNFIIYRSRPDLVNRTAQGFPSFTLTGEYYEEFHYQLKHFLRRGIANYAGVQDLRLGSVHGGKQGKPLSFHNGARMYAIYAFPIFARRPGKTRGLIC